jgi:hypothetical protein
MAETTENQPEGPAFAKQEQPEGSVFVKRGQPVLISPAQCRAARAWLNWKQAELAQKSGVGLSALKDFEAGNRRTQNSIRAQLQETFEAARVRFFSPHTITVPTREGPLWENSLSRFRPTAEALGLTDDGRRVVLDNGPATWLKIGPLEEANFHRYGTSIKTEILSKNLLSLLPMIFYIGDADFLLSNDGFGYSRTPPRNTFITDTVTFIFENGTLWSINTQILKEVGTIPLIPSDLVKAFTNFTALLDRYLEVPLPLRWQIGMEQLKGRRLLMLNSTGQFAQYGRECNVERVVSEGLYERGDGPYASLRPFFAEILARCGLDPVQDMKGYDTNI